MTHVERPWAEVYEPLLGLRLEQVVFCPLAGADTPDVVRDLNERMIGFSGSIQLGFEARRDLYLTWRQVAGGDFALASYQSAEDDWDRFSLDRVRMSQEEPWGRLVGATLARVEIYSVEGFGAWPEIAAAHHFQSGAGMKILWAGTAMGAQPGPGDDLFASLDVTPSTWQPMRLAETIQ